jgi:hypothetical protein
MRNAKLIVAINKDPDARVQTGTLRRGRRPVPDCPCADRGL